MDRPDDYEVLRELDRLRDDLEELSVDDEAPAEPATTRQRSHLHDAALRLAGGAFVLALAGCAFLQALAPAVEAGACAALEDVVDPGDGRTIVASLCPGIAKALARILAEGLADSGEGGTARRRGRCDPVQASQLDASAPRGAYLCRGKLGGDEQMRRLYRLAGVLAAERADAGAEAGR